MTDQSMPSLLMKAAQSAAEADGVSNEEGVVASNVLSSNGANNNALDMATAKAQMVVQQRQQQQRKPSSSGGSSKKKGQQLRRGKWTPEEEAYANRLIQEFKAGLLPLTDGTTLRTFLSKLLNCDPMRISKKFVGSNCIGKQVFRRRTADLNRLTPDQIQKSRAELSELERRFLERVAQTNRVKNSSAVGGGANQGGHHNNLHNQHMQNRQPMGSVGGVNSSHHNAVVSAALSAAAAANGQGMMNGRLNGNGGFRNLQTNPPWMQPPLGYKQGLGAQMARDNLSSASGHANSRTAAAGRALLEGLGGGNGRGNHFKNGEANNSNSMMAMAELQRRASMQMGFGHQSAQNLLAALSGGNSNQSLVQMARNASTNGSFNNLMKGFSRDQLSQLARDRGLSSASLSNMDNNGPRKNSFDQLMSLDFQSLQSIDNLANLIQTGGKPGGNTAPSIGMKNWSADHGNNNGNNNGGMLNGSLSNAARRLASHNNFESLMRNLSSTNNLNGRNGMNQHFGSDNFGNSSSSNNPLNGNDNDENNNNVNTGTSNANLQSLLQSMNSGKGSTSMSSLLGGGGNNASAASLANLLQRADNSSTGLSALRNSDGLNGRNTTSVEDFLSLVAAGDIPHQDPNVLNLPLSQLQQHQQQNANNNGGQQGRGDGDKDNNNGDNINHQQNDTANILAQATGNSALANALASRSFGSNMGSFADLSRNNLSSLGSTAELLQQLADSGGGSSSSNLKRKLLDLEGSLEAQGVSKR